MAGARLVTRMRNRLFIASFLLILVTGGLLRAASSQAPAAPPAQSPDVLLLDQESKFEREKNRLSPAEHPRQNSGPRQSRRHCGCRDGPGVTRHADGDGEERRATKKKNEGDNGRTPVRPHGLKGARARRPHAEISLSAGRRPRWIDAGSRRTNAADKGGGSHHHQKAARHGSL